MKAEFDLSGRRETAEVIKRNGKTVLVRVDALRPERVAVMRPGSPQSRKERASKSVFRAYMAKLGVSMTRAMRKAEAVVIPSDSPKTKVIKRSIKKHNVRFI